MSEKKEEYSQRKAVESLGIPFGGSFVCLKCYPKKKNEVKPNSSHE